MSSILDVNEPKIFDINKSAIFDKKVARRGDGLTSPSIWLTSRANFIPSSSSVIENVRAISRLPEGK